MSATKREKDYYPGLKSLLEEHLKSRFGEFHLEITATKAISNKLKAAIPAPLDPLARQHVGLRQARHLPRLPGIDQDYRKSPAFEQLEQGNPVHPGRLHGDGGDATGEQPVGQLFEIGRARAKGTHVGR